MTNSFKQFLFESEDFNIQYAIDGKDDAFVSDLVDKLSFMYQKVKERYMRPIKIVGVVGENIELRLHMSNKDIILFSYKGTETELKISINGDVVYHMDEIKKNEIIQKIEKYYKKFIEKQNFFLIKKNIPFG